MHNFRQFWLLYILYACELYFYSVGALSAYYELFGDEGLSFIGLSPEITAYLWLDWPQLLLAGPVIVGFPLRRPYVKRYWLGYIWLMIFLSVGVYDFQKIDLGYFWVGLAYPIVLTIILTLSAAGRTYFNFSYRDNGAGSAKTSASIKDVNYNSFLQMRLAKHAADKDSDIGPFIPESRIEYSILLMSKICAVSLFGLMFLTPPMMVISGMLMLTIIGICRRGPRKKKRIFFKRHTSAPEFLNK